VEYVRPRVSVGLTQYKPVSVSRTTDDAPYTLSLSLTNAAFTVGEASAKSKIATQITPKPDWLFLRTNIGDS
jgi:hypothetical protein